MNLIKEEIDSSVILRILTTISQSSIDQTEKDSVKKIEDIKVSIILT